MTGRLPHPTLRRGADRRRARGQALVEFALVIPLFLLLLMTLIDFGRVVYAQNTINQDAAEAARVGSVSADGLTKSPVDTFTPRYAAIRAAALVMAPAVPISAANDPLANIKGASGACSSATGTPAMPDDGTTGACFYPNGVNNSGPTTPPKIVVKISISVPLITPIISRILGGSISLTATSEQLLQ